VKITIESTDVITTIDGVPVRLWCGITEQGTRCDVFVVRIGAVVGAASEVLARELRKMPEPIELKLSEIRDLRSIGL
jgi:hypothetical protein